MQLHKEIEMARQKHFDDVMAMAQARRDELQMEIDKLDRVLAVAEKRASSVTKVGRKSGYKLSPEGREAIRESQRARWARRREAELTPKSDEPVAAAVAV